MWTLTTVLPFVISSWHRKSPVFYLPPKWFGPATYFLALPSAPTGQSLYIVSSRMLMLKQVLLQLESGQWSVKGLFES